MGFSGRLMASVPQPIYYNLHQKEVSIIAEIWCPSQLKCDFSLNVILEAYASLNTFSLSYSCAVCIRTGLWTAGLNEFSAKRVRKLHFFTTQWLSFTYRKKDRKIVICTHRRGFPFPCTLLVHMGITDSYLRIPCSNSLYYSACALYLAWLCIVGFVKPYF